MAPRHSYRFKAPCLSFPWGRAHPRGAGVGDGRAGCGGPPGTGAWTPAPGPAVLPAWGHPAGSSHACTLALSRLVLGGVSGGPWLGGREGGFPSHLREVTTPCRLTHKAELLEAGGPRGQLRARPRLCRWDAPARAAGGQRESLLWNSCVALGGSPLGHHGFQPGACKGPPEFGARPAPSLCPVWGSVWVNSTGRYKHPGLSDLEPPHSGARASQPWLGSSPLPQPHEAGAVLTPAEQTKKPRLGRRGALSGSRVQGSHRRWLTAGPWSSPARRGRLVWAAWASCVAPSTPQRCSGTDDSRGQFSE